MIGARHIIQRQFIQGFDVLENEDEYEDDPKMYLMEFMSVKQSHFVHKTSQYLFMNLNYGGANWD